MLGRTHLVTGFAAGAIVGSLTATHLSFFTVSIVMGGVGGLFPDLDCHGSIAGKLTGFIGTIISRLFKHRGVLHTPALYILLYSFISITGIAYEPVHWAILYGFLGGIGSHLFLDILNPAGLMLLWPVSRKRTHLLSLLSSGKGNILFRYVSLIILGIVIFQYVKF